MAVFGNPSGTVAIRGLGGSEGDVVVGGKKFEGGTRRSRMVRWQLDLIQWGVEGPGKILDSIPIPRLQCPPT
jgi:hypothetical protein